jgi:maltose/moltooligosaccharide transporter
VNLFAKPQLSTWQLSKLCIGAFGIQFGFALPNANATRIFQNLGASLDNVPLLWLAGPVTGLIVQPLVGFLSDRTWSRYGRRRPYFLCGAALAAATLIAMPNASTLWVAVLSLWVLDASLNLTMGPFRAFVADQTSADQRATGYVAYMFFASLGAVVGSLLPWMFAHLGVSSHAPAGDVSDVVKLAFGVGATFLLAAVCWSAFSMREYPPELLDRFDGATPERGADWTSPTMLWLALVQFCSWFTLFAVYVYTTPAVAKLHFGAMSAGSPAYEAGANWVGVLFATYNGFAAIAALIIPYFVRRFGVRMAHRINLWVGAAGLLSMLMIRDPAWLLLSMLGFGVAWASIVSLPYAMLANNLSSRKMGVNIGIFNIFIVIPQLLAGVVLAPMIKGLAGGDPGYAFVIGAIGWGLAGLAVLRVKDTAGDTVRAG